MDGWEELEVRRLDSSVDGWEELEVRRLDWIRGLLLLFLFAFFFSQSSAAHLLLFYIFFSFSLSGACAEVGVAVLLKPRETVGVSLLKESCSD